MRTKHTHGCMKEDEGDKEREGKKKGGQQA